MPKQKTLYKEHFYRDPDGAEVLVEVIAVECASRNFGRVYLMHAFASADVLHDDPLRLTVEVLDVLSDAAAQRIGIGLFDCLVKEVHSPQAKAGAT